MAPIIGGRYRLIECVHADGGRQCWRAEDEILGRPVRVWLYRGLDAAGARELRERVRTLHSIRLPGLAAVHDLVDDADEVAIVTAPVPCRTLADLLRERRPSLGTAAGIVSSLALTLDELHLHSSTVGALEPCDVLLGARGALILVASAAAADDAPARPDVIRLQELARAIVLGDPPWDGAPRAVRLALERGPEAREDRTAREFAGELAAAIAFDDRTEVLPRERLTVIRRAIRRRAHARAIASLVVLSLSFAAGGIAAAASRQPESALPRATTAPAARPSGRTIALPAAAPVVAAAAPAATPAATPAMVKVAARGIPSVIGMSRDDAARALMAAGATSVVWRIDPKAKGVAHVVRQEPAPGAPLARGGAVTVHLDSAKEQQR